MPQKARIIGLFCYPNLEKITLIFIDDIGMYAKIKRKRQPHPAPPKNKMSRGTTSAQVLQCNANCMQLYVTV